MKFSYKKALVSRLQLNQTGKKLNNEILNMNKATLLGYEDNRSSINLPADKKLFKNISNVVKEKQKLNPKYIIVVGIGGSNLGTIAVQEAVLGKQFNQLNPNIKILFADTVDTDSLQYIIKIIEPSLKKGENVIINGVSKSGGTTETIANFEILIQLIKKYKKNYHKYVVVTTDAGSKFEKLAVKNKFSVLEIPKKVGGRYSVFSAVGLFPLGMIGINLQTLLAGARDMRKNCLSTFNKNPAAISAALLYLHHKKRNIADLFLFSNDLESIGKWYRQLMGESIGKEFNTKGKRVFAGMTPTVSIGSIDLHSMAQLYLGGPQDKFTNFISVEKNKSNFRIPVMKEYAKLVDKIQGKPLSYIMDAILQGVKTAFIKGKRPFAEIILRDKSEYSIGALLQFKMMEMMYLGYLLEVNPFDQPNVEDYKIETKKILLKG